LANFFWDDCSHALSMARCDLALSINATVRNGATARRLSC
jgi:hypothetical protein